MSDGHTMLLQPGEVTVEQLRTVWRSAQPVSLPSSADHAMRASARAIARIVAKGNAVYGVNTGFGKLAQTRIANHELETLQRNLVLSHAAGVGDALPDHVVRLILVMKAASLARGFSGVRPQVVHALLALHNANIMPVIPAKGSVGASGDLAPLAHMTLALMGEGNVRVAGVVQPAAQALATAGIEAIRLGAKEGLALINGTQVSTALALHGLFMAERLIEAAMVIGAMSVDAARGSDTPFDARIHALRNQPGQIACAAVMRALLKDSRIRESHLLHDDRVQDPYSLRCQPQVMGACRDLLLHASRTLLREANAVTDNPLVFADTNEVLSGGNFHAEPVALAADTLALVIAETGALSERRIALLIDSALSGLPPFLVHNAGLNSGFMIAHVTAASLASENKSLAHPASVDSLPTSANQEDHVSMATFAARRLTDMISHSATILGIEWLAAAQGIDLHAPLTTAPALAPALSALRQSVPFYTDDRYFAADIEAAVGLVVNGQATEACADILSKLWTEP